MGQIKGWIAILMIVFGLAIVYMGNTYVFTLNGVGQCLVFGLLFGGFGILLTSRGI
jgi:hypothetical protein